MPDRFIPEYSPKVDAGDLPEPDITLGVEAITELLYNARMFAQSGMTMGAGIKEQVNSIWKNQPEEFRQSPRLRQQFMLEMYLAAYSRGSAVAEAQDLAVAVKALDRQKPIRQKYFTEEIPNQVGVYSKRLKDLHKDMLRRLRRGAAIDDVALSLRDLMTKTLAYKENDLPNFNQAWKAQAPFWVEGTITSKKNGHTYKKFFPSPDEDDTWLSPELTKGTVMD